MLNTVVGYVFLTVVLILGVLLGIQTWRLHSTQLEVAKVSLTLANERATASTAVATLQAESRKTEQTLQSALSTNRKQTNAQISALTTQRDLLLGRVRIAEARAQFIGGSGVPSIAAAPGVGDAAPGDPGTELLGTIGEPDVAEAYRADLIRLELAACYHAYAEARSALKGRP